MKSSSNGHNLTIFTLKEASTQLIPRQVYAFAKQETLQNIELLSDEDGSAICTDCKDYFGKVVHDGGLGFKLGF